MARQNALEEGMKAPEFCLPDQNGKEVCLNDFAGKWVTLYFYPKDDTPGCTREAIDFTGALKNFEKMNSTILGISPDSAESHSKFCTKHDLKITLLSDEERTVLEKYGVWQLKKKYGKEYFGVVRSTFLIDPNGMIAQIWRDVKVDGHVEDVLESLDGR